MFYNRHIVLFCNFKCILAKHFSAYFEIYCGKYMYYIYYYTITYIMYYYIYILQACIRYLVYSFINIYSLDHIIFSVQIYEFEACYNKIPNTWFHSIYHSQVIVLFSRYFDSILVFSRCTLKILRVSVKSFSLIFFRVITLFDSLNVEISYFALNVPKSQSRITKNYHSMNFHTFNFINEILT